MTRRALSVLAVLVLLAGCGGSTGGEEGTAELWVTRDRGATLLVEADVDAGQTLMRALAAETDLETSYGGRFIQSVNGIEGSLDDQHDWFWFVNGYEGDRSAADYDLHPGDVLWWDHRSWATQLRQPVVVGAFPEPFLHGWNGKRRPAVVRGPPGETAERLAELIGGSLNEKREGANTLVLVDGSGFRARVDGSAGDPVVFELGLRDARRLVREPAVARYRYEGLP